MPLAALRSLTEASQNTSTTGPAIFDDGTGANGSQLDTARWALGITPTGGGGTYQDGAIRLTNGSAGGYTGADAVMRRLNIANQADIELVFDYYYSEFANMYAVVRSDRPTADAGSGRGYALNLATEPRIEQFNNYNTTVLATGSVTVSPGTWYSARFRVLGSKIRARVWPRGTTEPSTWNVADIDSTTITAAGVTSFLLPGTGAPNQYLALDNVAWGVATDAPTTPMLTATATLSGSGGLGTTSSIALARPATLSGSGALAVVGRPGFGRTADLTGAGTLTAVAARSSSATAALEGSGALAATAVALRAASASLTGSGALVAQGTGVRAAVASLTGQGTLSGATVDLTVTAAALLSGSGALAVVSEAGLDAAASLSGSGALVSSARASVNRVVALSGAGSLVAGGLAKFTRAVVLSGSGQLDPGTDFTRSARPSFTGAGQIVSANRVTLSAVASLTGIGTLLLVTSAAQRAAVVLAGEGELEQLTAPEFERLVSLTGRGQLAATHGGVGPARPVNLSYVWTGTAWSPISWYAYNGTEHVLTTTKVS